MLLDKGLFCDKFCTRALGAVTARRTPVSKYCDAKTEFREPQGFSQKIFEAGNSYNEYLQTSGFDGAFSSKRFPGEKLTISIF